MYVIELLGVLKGLGLLKMQHLIYLRLSAGFGILFLFTNLNFMEFIVIHFVLFCLISVIDVSEWLWKENFCQNIQLTLVLHEALFLALPFSNYTSITFHMMLSVILLSMLMILLTVTVIWHRICGNSQSWLLNLSLTFETLQTESESSFLILILKKHCCYCKSYLQENWSLVQLYEGFFSRSCSLSV